jgi:hypothetical protein
VRGPTIRNPSDRGALTTSAAFANGSLEVSLKGESDLNDALVLRTFLEGVHEQAIGLRVSQVVVDLQELVFLNSSCFKGFVSWIAEVADSDQASQYKIRFLSSSKYRWQRQSLQALRCFAPDLVFVDENRNSEKA